MLCSKFSLVIYFILMHNIYVINPNLSFQPTIPSRFDVHTFVSTSVSLFLLSK